VMEAEVAPKKIPRSGKVFRDIHLSAPHTRDSRYRTQLYAVRVSSSSARTFIMQWKIS
jgi:hypothetical protein